MLLADPGELAWQGQTKCGDCECPAAAADEQSRAALEMLVAVAVAVPEVRTGMVPSCPCHA